MSESLPLSFAEIPPLLPRPIRSAVTSGRRSTPWLPAPTPSRTRSLARWRAVCRAPRRPAAAAP